MTATIHEFVLGAGADFAVIQRDEWRSKVAKAGRGPRGEILHQLDRIEHDLARAKASLRWATIVQVATTVALVLMWRGR